MEEEELLDIESWIQRIWTNGSGSADSLTGVARRHIFRMAKAIRAQRDQVLDLEQQLKRTCEQPGCGDCPGCDALFRAELEHAADG